MAKIKVAVYGTLRQGDYNFDRFVHIFGEDAITYLKTVTVKTDNYALISIGNQYPGLIHKSTFANRFHPRKVNTEITFDLLEVDSKCFGVIEEMEKGAGYRTGTIEIENETYKTFLYTYDDESNKSITSGDWFEYKNIQNRTIAYNKSFSAFEEVEKGVTE